METNIDQDFRIAVVIDTTKEKAFKAITEEVDKWWSTVDRPVAKVGDRFSVFFGEDSYWTFEIIHFDAPDIVNWKCIVSHQGHKLEGIDAEWLGTELHWVITDTDKGVRIGFNHQGLVPEFGCYEVCSKSWTYYVTESLKKYLETNINQVDV